MIVCHCRAVNHREIEAAVDDGARTVPEVGVVCGAGTECGGCLPVVAEAVSRRLGTPVEVPSRVRSRATAAA